MRIPPEDGVVWVDGVETPVAAAAVPITDPAVLVGLAIFETVAVRQGKPLQLDEHLDRLGAASERMGIATPGREVLVRTCLEAGGRAASCAWLKVLVTGGGRWYVFTGPMDAEEEGAAVTAVTLPWRRDDGHPVARLKTTSYAAHQRGMDWARSRGAQEGLWRNRHGHYAEGCFSNLFVVRRSALFTPSTREGILPGIVRATVIRTARETGIAVHETRLRVERVIRADEAFLTSSLGGLRPLVAVDERPVADGRPGPVTRRLAERVARVRRGDRW